MAKKQPPQNPIGFGRLAMPKEAGLQPDQAPAEERQPEPPLATPIFLDDVALYEFLGRYTIQPLAPLSKFEYQLVCLAAGLEQRIRALDPDL